MSSVVTVELFAPSLARQTAYTAIVPDAPPPWPVLYQLHGHDDDHRAWLYKSRLLQHAADFPMLIVMPSGENSYYVGAHELLVIDDIPAHVARTFQVRPGRAAIGGLSMGGYGAIRLGLLYPERYASIYAHSSRLPARAEVLSLAWARHQDLESVDVDAIAARADRASLPALAFDCGTEDYLLADSRRFHHHLEAIGMTHQYREHAGAHAWDYWDRYVVDALAHHRRALGV